jgi:hypothetical protein
VFDRLRTVVVVVERSAGHNRGDEVGRGGWFLTGWELERPSRAHLFASRLATGRLASGDWGSPLARGGSGDLRPEIRAVIGWPGPEAEVFVFRLLAAGRRQHISAGRGSSWTPVIYCSSDCSSGPLIPHSVLAPADWLLNIDGLSSTMSMYGRRAPF